MSDQTLKHKFLFVFSQFLDINKDGILSWEDYEIFAKVNAEAELKGKVDVGGKVLKGWTDLFQDIWNAIRNDADFNKDGIVDVGEFMRYFVNVRPTVKTFQDLPQSTKRGVPDYFRVMDVNQDGKICLTDYKNYYAANGMDLSQAEPRFKAMLNDNDKKNGNVITVERFKELMLLFYTTSDPKCPGNYAMGQYDKKSYEQLCADHKVRD